MNTSPDTEEHKEQAQEEQSEFQMRIAAERKAEAEELEKREAEEALMRASASKPKKVKKEKKPRKKRVKKEKKVVSVKIEPIVVKPRKLPVYSHQVEVNEFNKFKVDYIRKQIHCIKDKKRKSIYENALTKYDLTNYWNLN